MQITLAQFEQIDGQLSTVLRFPPFQAMTLAQCKDFISASNILLDYCIDAMGYEYANSFASAEECAAAIVTKALLSSTFVAEEA